MRRLVTSHKLAIRLVCVLAGLAAGRAAPLRGQPGLPETEFAFAKPTGVKSGGYTQVIAVPKPTIPSEWPDGLPLPGASLKTIEALLGRSHSSATLPADGGTAMAELTYPSGARLRIHERRGLGFIELAAPWKTSIFGMVPESQIPPSLLDLFPRTGRFIRGVFVAVPKHPHWFVDVDDRVDAVSRLLFVDRDIYGDLPGIPKGH